MALLKGLGSLPPGLDRTKQGWSLQAQAARPRVSRRRPTRRPSRNTLAQLQQWWYGYTTLQANRYWLSRISKWWKTPTWPGSYALFNAYAAAYPIDDYWGQLKTLNGHQWFTWLQVNSLRTPSHVPHKPEPNPIWYPNNNFTTPTTYPAYPNGSYPGDPAFSNPTALATAPYYFQLHFTSPGVTHPWFLLVSISQHTPGPNALCYPAHVALASLLWTNTLPGPQDFYFGAPYKIAFGKKGTRATMLFRFFDTATWQGGHLHLVGFTWP